MESAKISEGEKHLLEEWRRGDELALKQLLQRYERFVFALVLYLTGCDRDRAFSITVSAFARVIRASDSFQKEAGFLRALLREILRQCEGVPPDAKFDLSDFDDRPAHKKEALRVMKQALASLTPDAKKRLLLRDQIHLAYQDIAAVLDVPERDVKIQTIQARVQLMDKVKEIMERAAA